MFFMNVLTESRKLRDPSQVTWNTSSSPFTLNIIAGGSDKDSSEKRTA